MSISQLPPSGRPNTVITPVSATAVSQGDRRPRQQSEEQDRHRRQDQAAGSRASAAPIRSGTRAHLPGEQAVAE
jgi:hypothetical protein